ncbi:MAG: hypothetical protein JNN05_01030 [Candidatus Omnitrophica bacterium]|nr:hypothetical protein [Candidatus Omnitrophota bacterium]
MNQELKSALSSTAQLMIDQKIDLLDGVREILKQLHAFNGEEEKSLEQVLLSFTSFASQTDHIPSQSVHHLWDPLSWKSKQAEKDRYVQSMSTEIISAARELVKLCKWLIRR